MNLIKYANIYIELFEPQKGSAEERGVTKGPMANYMCPINKKSNSKSI